MVQSLENGYCSIEGDSLPPYKQVNKQCAGYFPFTLSNLLSTYLPQLFAVGDGQVWTASMHSPALGIS